LLRLLSVVWLLVSSSSGEKSNSTLHF
jgi:hypothetical protein